MRKAINENPQVQAGVVVVLAILAAVMIYMQVLRGGGAAEEPAASDPAAAAATTLPGAVAPTTGAPAVSTAPPTGAPVPEASATEQGFVAGPGLPKPVADAYAAGKAIVIFIVNPKGNDDKLVERSADTIGARGDTAVFIVDSDDVADYSRITEGVGVDRTPAVVTVRPKSITAGVPEASVTYGFRSTNSIVQAVIDALYEGPTVPYYPE